MQGAGSRIQGAGFRVQGEGCRVQGAGCRVGFRTVNASLERAGGEVAVALRQALFENSAHVEAIGLALEPLA